MNPHRKKGEVEPDRAPHVERWRTWRGESAEFLFYCWLSVSVIVAAIVVIAWPSDLRWWRALGFFGAGLPAIWWLGTREEETKL